MNITFARVANTVLNESAFLVKWIWICLWDIA